MSSEKIFADGFIFRVPKSAPDWVIGKLSIKVSDAIEFLNQYEEDGWVNLEVKESSGGKPYVELNTWKPDEKNRNTKKSEVADEDGGDDYGF